MQRWASLFPEKIDRNRVLDRVMNVSDFLGQCVCLDLETRGERVVRMGAVHEEASFERRGRFPLERAMKELDKFARGARYVLGHNVLGHDLPLLHRLSPLLGILRKPVVDTLFLSPLSFPQNPYHRLVKDYKLVKESLNDPVADARLAASVFADQWESFADALARGQGRILSLYRYCFHAPGFAGGLSNRGLVEVFDALGASPMDGSEDTKGFEGMAAEGQNAYEANEGRRSHGTSG